MHIGGNDMFSVMVNVVRDESASGLVNRLFHAGHLPSSLIPTLR